MLTFTGYSSFPRVCVLLWLDKLIMLNETSGMVCFLTSAALFLCFSLFVEALGMVFSADEQVAMLLSLYLTCRGHTLFPQLALVKFYAKQCVFCYAVTLVSSASLMTWLVM